MTADTSSLSTGPSPSIWVATAPLDEEHDTGHLNSGRDEIDDWLARQALRLQQDGLCKTYVWADQPPYVSGFYTLIPHRIDASNQTITVAGHTGGSITGYLIAKIGIHEDAAERLADVARPDPTKPPFQIPNAVLLVLEALLAANRAAEHAGGEYLFVDTSNEPKSILDALDTMGFVPMRIVGPMWALKLG